MALDQSAKVTHNAHTRDRDFGRLRQRDVWIEASLGGHFPYNALVSCKRYKRKLHQQDIDAFAGEKASSGASLGIVYSYSGFSAGALDKARSLGIHCCSLGQGRQANDPLEIPVNCYGSKPLTTTQCAFTAGTPWNEVVRMATDMPFSDEISSSLVDLAVVEFDRHFAAIHSLRTNPPSFHFERGVVSAHSGILVRLSVRCEWKTYRAIGRGQLTEGSFNFSTGALMGAVQTPLFDTALSHPGPQWTLMEPGEVDEYSSATMHLLLRPDIRGAIQRHLEAVKVEVSDSFRPSA